MVWDKVWEKTFNSQEWSKYPNEELIRFIARNFYIVDVLALVDLRVGILIKKFVNEG